MPFSFWELPKLPSAFTKRIKPVTTLLSLCLKEMPPSPALASWEGGRASSCGSQGHHPGAAPDPHPTPPTQLEADSVEVSGWGTDLGSHSPQASTHRAGLELVPVLLV